MNHMGYFKCSQIDRLNRAWKFLPTPPYWAYAK
jgi:hypothetical protein